MLNIFGTLFYYLTWPRVFLETCHQIPSLQSFETSRNSAKHLFPNSLEFMSLLREFLNEGEDLNW